MAQRLAPRPEFRKILTSCQRGDTKKIARQVLGLGGTLSQRAIGGLLQRPPDRGLAALILAGEFGHGLAPGVAFGNAAPLARV